METTLAHWSLYWDNGKRQWNVLSKVGVILGEWKNKASLRQIIGPILIPEQAASELEHGKTRLTVCSS